MLFVNKKIKDRITPEINAKVDDTLIIMGVDNDNGNRENISILIILGYGT